MGYRDESSSLWRHTLHSIPRRLTGQCNQYEEALFGQQSTYTGIERPYIKILNLLLQWHGLKYVFAYLFLHVYVHELGIKLQVGRISKD